MVGYKLRIFVRVIKKRMTDENCNNVNVETYIGNGTSWDKI